MPLSNLRPLGALALVAILAACSSSEDDPDGEPPVRQDPANPDAAASGGLYDGRWGRPCETADGTVSTRTIFEIDGRDVDLIVPSFAGASCAEPLLTVTFEARVDYGRTVSLPEIGADGTQVTIRATGITVRADTEAAATALGANRFCGIDDFDAGVSYDIESCDLVEGLSRTGQDIFALDAADRLYTADPDVTFPASTGITRVDADAPYTRL